LLSVLWPFCYASCGQKNGIVDCMAAKFCLCAMMLSLHITVHMRSRSNAAKAANTFAVTHMHCQTNWQHSLATLLSHCPRIVMPVLLTLQPSCPTAGIPASAVIWRQRPDHTALSQPLRQPQQQERAAAAAAGSADEELDSRTTSSIRLWPTSGVFGRTSTLLVWVLVYATGTASRNAR
jgi:hypothetical protein